MTRELTDPDNDDLLEWNERVTDFDGDSLSVSLELDAIDDGSGWTQQDTDSSNLGWLSFSTTKDTLPDGTREAVVDVEADKTQLTAGSSYRFEVVTDDGYKETARMFVLYVNSVAGKKMYALNEDDLIEEYNLGNPWGTSTSTLKQSVNLLGFTGIFFGVTEKKCICSRMMSLIYANTTYQQSGTYQLHQKCKILISVMTPRR